MIDRIKNSLNKKTIVILTVATVVVIISGGATYAVLSVVEQKGDTEKKGTEEATPKKAEALNTKAKDLLTESTKLGNTEESVKMTEEAAAKFGEASKQYEMAGDEESSNEAKANSELLMSRLALEEEYRTKQEAESARQKAEYEAAVAKMREAMQ